MTDDIDTDDIDTDDAAHGGDRAGDTLPPEALFGRVRSACATVAGHARRVTIDDGALDRLATTLVDDAPSLLPEERPSGDEEAMATEVVVWNAVNFGSGWFPVLTKRDGLSGARSLAEALADHVAAKGVPTAEWLTEVDALTCAEVFDQPYPGEVDELLDLFAEAWHDLGVMLADRFTCSAAELVRSAGGSAARLAGTLGAMPLAQDVAWYETEDGGFEVPLYKRAQITVSHLARAFGNEGLGRFDDADQLTAFADNLVPHVLRMAGVLVYDDRLAKTVEKGDLLAPGGAEEVEIRACGLHAVEMLAGRTGLTAASIDHQLWQRGQDPAIKSVPRHRCRCPWY